MRKFSRKYVGKIRLTALLMAAPFLFGAVSLWPSIGKSTISSAEGQMRMRLRQHEAAVDILVLALDRYAEANKGQYPPPAAVFGGEAGPEDALLKGGFLKEYPMNPLREGWRIRQAAGMPGHRPGDFRYSRNEKAPYQYTLEIDTFENGRPVSVLHSSEG